MMMHYYYHRDRVGECYYLYHDFFLEGICLFNDTVIVCRKNVRQPDLLFPINRYYRPITKQVYEAKLLEVLAMKDVEVVVL